MPYALAIIAILLIVTGARGTYGDLKKLLVSDFTGDNNFFYWIAAIGACGVVGYVPDLEKFSRAFITLILVAMILSQNGFAQKFMEALGSIRAGAGTGSGSSSGASTPAPNTFFGLNPNNPAGALLNNEIQGLVDMFSLPHSDPSTNNGSIDNPALMPGSGGG